ncbi:hypothetical protein FHS85_002935 [Rhodoligotrophos appendicifer]|uniref:hypothetical protein n=1 Tax=Rhodoligotrophos appendicifer TaxID=987056 RepID=UPI001186FB69|nr:hypothetical protein [Rhodoligotrophos appendicifer]
MIKRIGAAAVLAVAVGSFCLPLLVVSVPAAQPRIIQGPPYPLPPGWQAPARQVIHYARCFNA